MDILSDLVDASPHAFLLYILIPYEYVAAVSLFIIIVLALAGVKQLCRILNLTHLFVACLQFAYFFYSNPLLGIQLLLGIASVAAVAYAIFWKVKELADYHGSPAYEYGQIKETSHTNKLAIHMIESNSCVVSLYPEGSWNRVLFEVVKPNPLYPKIPLTKSLQEFSHVIQEAHIQTLLLFGEIFKVHGDAWRDLRKNLMMLFIELLQPQHVFEDSFVVFDKKTWRFIKPSHLLETDYVMSPGNGRLYNASKWIDMDIQQLQIEGYICPLLNFSNPNKNSLTLY